MLLGVRRFSYAGGDGRQATVGIGRAGEQAKRLLIFALCLGEVTSLEEGVAEQRVGARIARCDLDRGAELAERGLELPAAQVEVAGRLVHAVGLATTGE